MRKYFVRITVFMVLMSAAGMNGIYVQAGAAAGSAIGQDPAWEGRSSRWYRWWDEVDLAELAEEQFEARDYRAAAATYGRMARLAERRENSAWAMMRRAEAHIGADRLNRAAEDYKTVIERWPEEINYRWALERLHRIAEVFADEKGSLLWMIPFNRTHQAIELYEFILEKASGHPDRIKWRMRLAELQRRDGEKEAAMQTWRRVFSQYPHSEHAPTARIKYMEVKFNQAGGRHDRPELLRQVVSNADSFLRNHPRHELAEKAQEIKSKAENRLAANKLELAEFYLHSSHYNPEAGRRYLREVLEQYPDTEAAGKAEKIINQLDKDGNNPDSGGNPSNDQSNEPQKVNSKAVITSLAVSSIENPTLNPELAAVLRQQLNEAIMQDETVKLQRSSQAEGKVELEVKDFSYSAAGSAKLRDDDEIPDGVSAHTTTIYTAFLDARYRVVDESGEVRRDWSELQGRADFPRMPDMAMARETAIEQAAKDLSVRIVRDIVDVW